MNGINLTEGWKTFLFNYDDDHKTFHRRFSIYQVIEAYLIHSFIIVFGLVFNVLVVYSVLRHKSKQTVTNVFIANIAVANVILSLFVIPIVPVNMIATGWPLGSFMCHLCACINYSAGYASMLTLTSIAVNRYLVIVHQIRQMTRKLLIVIVIIWIISIGAALPFGIFYNVKYYQITHCIPQWPDIQSYYVYYQTTFAFLFVIPLVVMVSFYIALSLRMSSISIPHCPTRMADKRRKNRLLIAMAIVFCICSMPESINEMLSDNIVFSIDFKHYLIIDRVTHVMAMSSTCFTPLFYKRLNKMTIKQFCLVGPCFKHQPDVENDDETTASTYTVLSNDIRADDVTYHVNCDAVELISAERGG